MGKGSKSDGDGVSLTCGRWTERIGNSVENSRWEEEKGATSMACERVANLGKIMDVMDGACLNGERQGCQETPSRFINWPWFQKKMYPN